MKNNIYVVKLLETNVILPSHRYYPKEVIQKTIDKIINRVNKKEFVGELYNPSSKDPSRQLTVLYKECSHIITKLFFEDNILYGNIETLKTENGILLKRIIDCGLEVNFSLRSIGGQSLIKEHDITYYKVIYPIHIITWDAFNKTIE